ncbi:EF-hand domain-containing protein [Mesorhizobium sp. KR1-2]|uniref:EF-hand domain-containing protein n=1 Tax=Mesorhizobium sp. KR1-2 TaxID=3156609 RepID=UPI0032B58844
MFTGITRVTTIVAAVAISTIGAAAQTHQTAPQQSNLTVAQANPPEDEDQGAPPRMMQGGHPGMMGRRPGISLPMLKILFAIIDTDEDGSISFEEVTAVHKRIFDAIDTDKDGKITLDELEAFMRGP